MPMREIIFYRTESAKCPVEDFLDSLSDKQFEKVAFVLDLIEQLHSVPQEYLKKLKGTSDIWEIRVQQGNNAFRLLGFFDSHNLVVLNHAFAKKTRKTPQKDIALAEQRKQDYFRRKRLQ